VDSRTKSDKSGHENGHDQLGPAVFAVFANLTADPFFAAAEILKFSQSNCVENSGKSAVSRQQERGLPLGAGEL
jgi:hypothetical protein